MLKSYILPLIIIFNINSVQARDVLTFGIVPQQSSSELAKAWAPIVNFLSKKTGKEIRFKTAPNIPEFEARVAAGEYDIAYMNPYHYTVFSNTVGMRAIARQKDTLIHGIIVVRKDSPITSLEMLNGSELAFPAPAAFAATILPQAIFNLDNINISSTYVSSHDSVYSGVSKELFIAGGGIDRTFSIAQKKLGEDLNLKVLWRSKGYTPHAFAVHPRVNDKDLISIQNALLSLNQEEEGIKLLKKIGFKGVISSIDSDWDDVRSLKINSLISYKIE